MKTKFRTKYLISFFILFVTALTLTYSQNVSKDFLQMKGNVVLHSFNDMDDSLSVKEIVELRANNGIPIWFGRDVKKIVCFTGVCRLAHLWLFWNGVGDYLGFQLNENEPLTKTDHIEFSQADYLQLHKILNDSLSVLKAVKEEDLVDDFKGNNALDGHTGATRTSFKDELVKNAAYTCYSLWHTVYGKTRMEIQKIIGQRMDSAYLQMLLDGDDIKYQKWAINYISNTPEYQRSFNQRIVSMIATSDNDLFQSSLGYLSPELLSGSDIQSIFFNMFENTNLQRKFQIVWKLSQLTSLDNNVILFLLKEFEGQKISASMLTYVYKSIRPKNLKDKGIRKELHKFRNNGSLFVRNLTQRLMWEAKNKN